MGYTERRVKKNCSEAEKEREIEWESGIERYKVMLLGTEQTFTLTATSTHTLLPQRTGRAIQSGKEGEQT